MKVETVSQRFAALISDLGISKNAFAKSLGRTATVVQHLLDGRNKPGFDLLETLFTVYPNVSKDWIMLGKGPRYTDTPAPATSEPSNSQSAASAEPIRPATSAPKIAPRQPTEPPTSPDLPPAPKADPIVAPSASAVATSAVASAAPDQVAVPASPVKAANSNSTSALVAPSSPPSPDAYLLAQHVIHQLALAEQRAQFLEQQQQLMQQMVELMRKAV